MDVNAKWYFFDYHTVAETGRWAAQWFYLRAPNVVIYFNGTLDVE